MTDRTKQQVLPPPPSRLPAVQAPRPSLPVLPSSSGAFWGNPTTLLRKDTAYVVAHAEHLRARSDQAVAMRELVESREQLSIAISKLHALSEICAHHYELGRRSRHAELRLADLKHQTDEAQAQVQLAATRLALAQYQPQPPEPPAPPPPPAPKGLTPAEVRQAAQMMPEVKPETIEALVLMLGGMLAEKDK